MKQNNVLKESLGNFLRNAYDLLALNWLWLLCSLPVVTIGPATTALYAVTLKLAEEEPVSLVKDFFKAFKEEFLGSLAMGLLVLVLTVVALGDAWFAVQQTGAMQVLFLVVAFLVGLAALTLLTFGFALQARFRNGLKKHITNAFSLVFVAPGKMLRLMLVLLLPVLLALCLPLTAVKAIGFLYIMYGVSLPIYVNSRTLRYVFRKAGEEAQHFVPPASDEQKRDMES